ncbi:MAG TPA: hypothetical protein VEK73_06920 [Xanthobacteraceae bacterium]|nr:hypothetical protein [Xanthobacteraceae bacterium]
MLELVSREDVGAAQPPVHAVRRRPSLSLTWALDPTTGKPVGRWVVDGAQAAASLALASAA